LVPLDKKTKFAILFYKKNIGYSLEPFFNLITQWILYPKNSKKLIQFFFSLFFREKNSFVDEYKTDVHCFLNLQDHSPFDEMSYLCCLFPKTYYIKTRIIIIGWYIVNQQKITSIKKLFLTSSKHV
jgi:hypothetical protein